MNNILADTLIQKLLFHPKWWLLRHFLFWAFIYLDEFLSLIGFTEAYEDYLSIGVSLSFDIMIVYFNLYILYPRFLKTGRLAEYALYTALSVAILFGCEYVMDIFYWKDSEISLEYFIAVFTATAVTLLSAVAIKILKDHILEREHRKETEKQKLTVELDYLKKQVNPHFLFNVLNGIYIQSQTDHKKVPDTIMQLSDLLRYQIYDAEKNDQITISKEIEFLKNYIALEEMRREKAQVTMSIDIDNPMFLIEPLLFVPLIENAFKYSTPKNGQSAKIDIDIFQENGNLTLVISNSIGIIPDNSNSEGGHGLNNLKKRLAHLYPKTHNLDINTSNEGIFSVKLEIYADDKVHNRR